MSPQKRGVAGGLPQFHILMVPLNWETLQIIAPYSVILAVVGLLESLMTVTLIDELTETRGNNNRECLGQGIANVVSGFFGTMGGCAMIGQSMINVSSGGRGRLSGISAAISLLLCILFAPRFIEMVPLAERYFNLGKRLHLKHLSTECQYLLNNIGNSVSISIIKEPHSHALPSRNKWPGLEVETKSPATTDDTESTVV